MHRNMYVCIYTHTVLLLIFVLLYIIIEKKVKSTEKVSIEIRLFKQMIRSRIVDCTYNTVGSIKVYKTQIDFVA